MSRPLADRRTRSLTIMLICSVALAACGSAGGSDSLVATTRAPATTAAPVTDAPTTAPPTTEAPDPTITSEDLATILPTAEEIGGTFAEVEPVEESPFIRLGVIDKCPGAVAITREPSADAVEVTVTEDTGISLYVRLTPDVAAAPDAAADEAFVDALNDCSFAIRTDGVLHSLQWAAGIDAIGDRAIRGAVTDSLSSDAKPEPVGINTYFADIQVGDVGILIRMSDGYDGTQRIKLEPDELASVAQEMVSRVEELQAG